MLRSALAWVCRCSGACRMPRRKPRFQGPSQSAGIPEVITSLRGRARYRWHGGSLHAGSRREGRPRRSAGAGALQHGANPPPELELCRHAGSPGPILRCV